MLKMKLLPIVAIGSVMMIVLSFFTTIYLQLFVAAFISVYFFLCPEEEIVYLFFFLIPFSNIFNLGSSSLLLLLKFVIAAIWIMNNKFLEKFFVRNIAIFILYCLMVSFVGDTINKSSLIRIANLFLWCFVIYIFVNWITKNNFHTLLLYYIYSLILSCTVALFSDYIPGIKNMLTDSSINEADAARFSGLWNDPNSFSMFMGIGLAICFLLFSNRVISSIQFYILSITLSVFALLSFSKMCLVIIIVLWVIVFFVDSNMSLLKKFTIIFALGLLIAALCIFKPEIVSVYMVRILKDRNSGYSIDALTTHRSVLWLKYIQKLNASGIAWLFGFGIEPRLPDGRAAHQTILQIIYNIGTVGLVIYIDLLFNLFKYAGLSLKSDKRKRLNIMFFLPIGIVFVCSMFLDNFYIESFYFLIYLSSVTFYGFRYYKTENV